MISEKNDLPSQPTEGKSSTKKTVSFSRTKSIFLIPERQEYVDHNIHLWWKSEDYAAFKTAAIKERIHADIKALHR